MSEQNRHKLLMGKHAFSRGGKFLLTVFQRENKKLNGDECLRLKNQYAFRIENVVLLAISHGFEIDEEDFIRALDEDEERGKRIQPTVNR